MRLSLSNPLYCRSLQLHRISIDSVAAADTVLYTSHLVRAFEGGAAQATMTRNALFESPFAAQSSPVPLAAVFDEAQSSVLLVDARTGRQRLALSDLRVSVHIAGAQLAQQRVHLPVNSGNSVGGPTTGAAQLLALGNNRQLALIAAGKLLLYDIRLVQ